MYDECFTDSDCGAGRACLCGTVVSYAPEGYVVASGNTCIPASCHVDADCADGYQCSLSDEGSCGGGQRYACHTASDECVDPTDCAHTNANETCASTGSVWTCVGCGTDS